jgi:hypothetical protein
VLINGAYSRFFKASRGLIYGFPPSPFSFLIVIEVLCRIPKEEKYFGLLRQVKDHKGNPSLALFSLTTYYVEPMDHPSI